MSELIEMPYGNGKALEREFIKKYSEVQLDVEMKRKQCFVNYHCSSEVIVRMPSIRRLKTMTVYCDCEKCENNEDGFCYAEKIYMSDNGVCLSCCGIVAEESEDDVD